jgi:hypothetical protein
MLRKGEPIGKATTASRTHAALASAKLATGVPRSRISASYPALQAT